MTKKKNQKSHETQGVTPEAIGKPVQAALQVIDETSDEPLLTGANNACGSENKGDSSNNARRSDTQGVSNAEVSKNVGHGMASSSGRLQGHSIASPGVVGADASNLTSRKDASKNEIVRRKWKQSKTGTLNSVPESPGHDPSRKDVAKFWAQHQVMHRLAHENLHK